MFAPNVEQFVPFILPGLKVIIGLFNTNRIKMDNLSISNLSKTYPNDIKALQNITLEIPQGMFGLLGPNGAGKSTLMRTIATLQEADSGTVKLRELDALNLHAYTVPHQKDHFCIFVVREDELQLQIEDLQYIL
ncbi:MULTISPECIES: ATP-binding cassette domain-containing protein [Sphingobacterium]|uniref:ATP-binding cassette domain-containing protein n=1 Tax=Sphingobacterium TaxID=28453 RepID=UPI00257E62BD|nr:MULTISPECIES: ATP-binding cassette domain-containing protein [Sphingobacterium]